jgi:hypothetical protein
LKERKSKEKKSAENIKTLILYFSLCCIYFSVFFLFFIFRGKETKPALTAYISFSFSEGSAVRSMSQEF